MHEMPDIGPIGFVAILKLDRWPEELEDLEAILSDTYFCNF